MKAVRSGGPGGQNVNKVASKVELRVDLSLIQGMSEAALIRLRAKVANQLDAEGCWLLTSSRTRDQVMNLADVRDKVARALEAALVVPIPRRATRPTKGSQTRRLNAKKATGERKRTRQSKSWD